MAQYKKIANNTLPGTSTYQILLQILRLRCLEMVDAGPTHLVKAAIQQVIDLTIVVHAEDLKESITTSVETNHRNTIQCVGLEQIPVTNGC